MVREADALDQIATAFNQNVTGVQKLVSFDRDVLDIVLTGIRDLHERLRKNNIENPDLNGEKLLRLVSDIRKNDSLRQRYQTIFNQAVVLLVSYFASAVGDIFRYGLAVKFNAGTDRRLLDEEIRLTFGELKDKDWNVKEAAPDLLIAKKDLSFQDMGSTHRAFFQYLGVRLEQDKRVNNIITAQACRHSIVHAGAVVTDRLLRQIRNVTPRDLKPILTAGANLSFVPDEVDLVWSNMQAYVNALVTDVRHALKNG